MLWSFFCFLCKKRKESGKQKNSHANMLTSQKHFRKCCIALLKKRKQMLMKYKQALHSISTTTLWKLTKNNYLHQLDRQYHVLGEVTQCRRQNTVIDCFHLEPQAALSLALHLKIAHKYRVNEQTNIKNKVDLLTYYSASLSLTQTEINANRV